MEERTDKDTGRDVRSEKMRKLLDDRPGGVARWGISLICVIFAALIAIVLSLEFPYGNGESIFSHLFNVGK